MEKAIKLGASYTIGSHILPGEPLIKISEIFNNQVNLKILRCRDIIEGVKNNTFDFGLIEAPIFDDDLIYKEWMEDELVVCSKTPLGASIDAEMISRCQLLCRKERSPTRQLIASFFRQQGLSYYNFDSLMEIDNATSAIQGVKWSKPNREYPTVAIVSQFAIEEELKRKELYQARVGGKPIVRYFYLIYGKNKKDDTRIEETAGYLKAWQFSLLAKPA